MILGDLRELRLHRPFHLKVCRLIDELPFVRVACGVSEAVIVIVKACTMKREKGETTLLKVEKRIILH